MSKTKHRIEEIEEKCDILANKELLNSPEFEKAYMEYDYQKIAEYLERHGGIYND